jgi:hypothetical protein
MLRLISKIEKPVTMPLDNDLTVYIILPILAIRIAIETLVYVFSYRIGACVNT